MVSRMPWLARQSGKAERLFSIDSVVQAAGVVLTGCLVALTGPLDRSHAPGWPGTSVAVSVKVLPPGPVSARPRPEFSSEAIEMTVWRAGIRFGRIHSGMATWTAAKMARVTAMAGRVRRISAPAVTPRVKANAA